MRFLDNLPPARPSFSHISPGTTPRDGSPRSGGPGPCSAEFTLTRAVRPGWQGGIDPTEGYRLDAYVDQRSGSRLPAMIASVSAERLFETFMSLLEPIGPTCDVVLESSHEADYGHHHDYLREGIERMVLESALWDFEELLVDDGCTGIAVMHPERPIEVQLDEHKLLVVYSDDLDCFEDLLRGQGIRSRAGIRFITQGEHLHASHCRFQDRFDELRGQLGAS